jgi:isopenicillin-N N-acyltransferase-like protein
MKTLSTVILGITITFLALGLFFIQETSAQERDVSKLKIPKVESRGGVYYVVLDGATPYARGYQHGKALKFPITMALRNFTEWLRANAGIKDPEEMIQDFAKSTGYIVAAQQQVPDLIEEMKGISEGAGVDFNELFVYQSFDELFLFLMQSGAMDRANGHCTTTAVYGRKGLPNYVTHNNDIPTYHEAVGTVLHIKYPDSDLEILQGTFAGQIAQNGVNNRGLGVGINTIADLAKTQSGLPVSFNVRKILECGDRNEAVSYLDGIQAGTAMNYMLCDRGKAVSVETWEGNSKIVDVYEGNYAVHSNHALHKGAPTTFKMDASSGGGSYGFTHQRLELGLKIMKQKADVMTFEGVREMKSTRPILVYPGKPTGRTHQSMIVEIPSSGSPALYTTPDSPNRFEHVRFTFDD